MKTRPIVIALVLAASAMMAAEARAQLFSRDRALGTSLSRRGRATASATEENVGTVTGSERYIRGNRSESDFVGTDSRETREFVGAQNSVTTSRRPSTGTVRIETAPDANRSRTTRTTRSSRGGLYSPRLAIGFEHPTLSADEVSTSLSGQLAVSLTDRLQSLFARHRIHSIEVSVADGTATLRGTVSSEHERSLARLLALFEPGISEVRNELAVGPLPAPSSRSAVQPVPPQPAEASSPDTVPAK